MKIDVPRVRAFWRDQQGSAILECALVLPVLIALLTGVFEFSWLFYQQHLVSIGLRDASSYLANAPDPCNPNSRVWAIDQVRARNLAVTGTMAGGRSRVNGWNPAMVMLQCTEVDNPVEPSGLRRYRGSSVYVVSMSTQFTYPSLGFLDLLKLQSPVISASYSERVLGYH